MIKNQEIICISSTTWYGDYTKSTVQILERLAVSNQILFVEYPHTFKDIILTFKGRAVAQIWRMLG